MMTLLEREGRGKLRDEGKVEILRVAELRPNRPALAAGHVFHCWDEGSYLRQEMVSSN